MCVGLSSVEKLNLNLNYLNVNLFTVFYVLKPVYLTQKVNLSSCSVAKPIVIS